MSITLATYKSPTYTITALPQTCATTFAFQVPGDLLVVDTGSTGTPKAPVVLTLNSDYTVTGGGYDSNTNLQTGSVVVAASGANSVLVGDQITILRGTTADQQTKFASTGVVTFQMIEQLGDKCAMLEQKLTELSNRSLRFEPEETLDGTLALLTRKGTLLGFDASTGALSYSQATGIYQGIVNLAITAETGGGTTAIDGISTTALPNPYLLLAVIGGSSALYKLQTSSATVGTGVIKPLDNAALRWIRAG